MYYLLSHSVDPLRRWSKPPEVTGTGTRLQAVRQMLGSQSLMDLTQLVNVFCERKFRSQKTFTKFSLKPKPFTGADMQPGFCVQAYLPTGRQVRQRSLPALHICASDMSAPVGGIYLRRDASWLADGLRNTNIGGKEIIFDRF
jgi:hypothetical protein